MFLVMTLKDLTYSKLNLKYNDSLMILLRANIEIQMSLDQFNIVSDQYFQSNAAQLLWQMTQIPHQINPFSNFHYLDRSNIEISNFHSIPLSVSMICVNDFGAHEPLRATLNKKTIRTQ